MKKTLSVALLFASSSLIAQTNTFPPSGSVGIGAPVPTQKLDVVGNILLRNLTNTVGAGNSILFSSYDAAFPGPRINSYLDYADGLASASRLILSSYDSGYKNEITLKSGRVGIGTIAPVGTLDVRGKTFIVTPDYVSGTTGSFMEMDQGATSGNTYSQIRAFNTGGSVVGDLILQSAGGNVGFGTVVPTQKVDIVGNILLRNMKNVVGAGCSISLSSFDAAHPGPKISSYLDIADGTASVSRLVLSSYSSGYMNEITLKAGKVGIGTLDPQETLSVNGSVRSKSVKVETVNWPDYVFDESYNLQSLEELGKYLSKNKHLPEMPSAKEIEEKGQNLGEINSKLLKNVEELTLYLIEKDKQLKNETDRNEAQQLQITAQQVAIDQITIQIQELKKQQNNR